MEVTQLFRVFSRSMTRRESEKYEAYMAMAFSMASLSHDTRMKVGALLMRDGRVLSSGYNGTPAGSSNESVKNGDTAPEVIHAEANAICYAARHGVSLEGATLVCTHAPCVTCAKLLLQAGIKFVCYRLEANNQNGLLFLEQHGVVVWQHHLVEQDEVYEFNFETPDR